MVVILILGLLATIVVQSLQGRDRQGQEDQGPGRHRCRSRPRSIAIISTTASYPTSDQGLPALVSAHKRQRARRLAVAAISKRCPQIRGATPYFYQSDGDTYVLKSFGADGVEGGTGKNADIDGSSS